MWKKLRGRSETNKRLVESVSSGSFTVVKELLESGADVEAGIGQRTRKIGQEGLTPLCAASFYGHPEIVAVLLEHGADVDGKYHLGFTPLICAAQEGHAHVVSDLLAHGAEVNMQSGNDATALIVATIREHAGIVKILLKHGADPDASDADLRTPLIHASMDGREDIVEVLLAAGADVEAMNANEETALFWAPSRTLVDTLIRAGASTEVSTISGATPLAHASSNQCVDLIEFWIEHGVQVNTIDYQTGATALAVAAEVGCDVGVRKLLDGGADPNLGEYCYPIYSAAQEGHAEIVEMLAEAGANLNIKCGGEVKLHWAGAEETSKGHAPVVIAAASGHADVIRALAKHGADLETEYRVATDAARREGHADIVKLLREVCGKRWWES